MDKISAVNDFVIRFATVNGSGSASANNMFARAVIRHGVPASPKNIFPSNIQGLPTWYEVRINEHGYLGRRGGVDFMVAVNGRTLFDDYRQVLPGGYFLYDSTKRLPPGFTRKDITEIGIPLARLCNEEYQEPRQRQMFKNIAYVGALAYLFNMEFSVFTESVKQKFKKKIKLIDPNIKALDLGYYYAKEHYPKACSIAVERRDCVGDFILVDGNSAAGLGALYGGATFAGWYPITPSTSVVDAFEAYSEKFRLEAESGRRKFAVVQAEDELAAIGMVIGAAWNGSRSFTATSGPGVSLMNEFIGLAYFAEIPAVIVNVQRAGPSTGMPTRTQQGDLLTCAYASHGDTRHPMLFPCNPEECFDMTATALDLADRLQTPIFVMSDLDLGMNDNLSPPMVWDDKRRYDRGKVLDAKALEQRKTRWGRYLDEDGDGIPYRTYPGTHPTLGSYFTRGSSHDEYARYTESSAAYERDMQRLMVKWQTAKTLVPVPHARTRGKDSPYAALFFGTSTHSSYEALSGLKKEGVPINSMRIRSFPFSQEIKKFIDQHDLVFIIEQNRDGQMRTLLINECGIVPAKLVSVLNIDGMPITARFISKHIHRVLADHKVIAINATVAQ